ncbi:MAG: hypothetical protein P0107_05825 [Nitrosomonas sp.]|nr:hypothetical protein [Nitrosomonas sp.]
MTVQRGTPAQDMDDAVDQAGSQLFMTDDQNTDHFAVYLFVC